MRFLPGHLVMIIAVLVFIGAVGHSLTLDYGIEEKVPCVDIEGNEMQNQTCIKEIEYLDGIENVLFALLVAITIFISGYLINQLYKVKNFTKKLKHLTDNER